MYCKHDKVCVHLRLSFIHQLPNLKFCKRTCSFLPPDLCGQTSAARDRSCHPPHPHRTGTIPPPPDPKHNSHGFIIAVYIQMIVTRRPTTFEERCGNSHQRIYVHKRSKHVYQPLLKHTHTHTHLCVTLFCSSCSIIVNTHTHSTTHLPLDIHLLSCLSNLTSSSGSPRDYRWS